MIDRTLMQLRRGGDCCSVLFQVYRPAHIEVSRSVYFPHTLERPLGIVQCTMSRPQD